MSRVISLNGTWHIAADPHNRGREERWFQTHPPSHAQVTRVPSVIQETFPGYHGVAWYWRSFSAPEHPDPGGRYLLRFWAVGYLAEVWINGKSVGAHEGGESPFVLDATNVVVAGENTVAVRVLNPSQEPIDGIVLKETPHRNKADPPSPGSDLNHGGIFLPVDLMVVPAVRISDVFARPDWKTGEIRVQVSVRNSGPAIAAGELEVRLGPAAGGETLVERVTACAFDPSDSTSELIIRADNHRLWSLDDPFLYRLTVTLRTDGQHSSDETTSRIGFRDLRVERGYFRLNGNRIFLKSTHTGNCSPVGQIIAPDSVPDILRRDLLYAKACGYNMVRFISMMAHPWQLDMCDEIGLMVYEESYAAWLLEDSPEMGRRFSASVRDMVLRDRNHPSLTIYGLLNETRDGPVFREAVKSLALVRSLDETRLVLLSSGRWDGQRSIGSVSNPDSTSWEHVWGREAPGAAPVPAAWDSAGEGYVDGAGDAHVYPSTPPPPESDRLIRTLGHDSKPVFLSEYGIGSMMDVVHEARTFEQYNHRDDLEDYQALRNMEQSLVEDMRRWRMLDVYPFPEDLLIDSQERMARHRIHGFNLIRSNPHICGYNLTGMLDHALSGEGMWRLWRDWKPGAMDALQNGWWPLRWCLFASPGHAYAGQPVRVEAVLANEDVLGPGRYPVCFRIQGPDGPAWERRVEVEIPDAPANGDPPLAVSVLDEEVVIDGPAGTYRLVADMERGGAPLNRSEEFYLSDRPSKAAPHVVATWGLDPRTEKWLSAHGVDCRPLQCSSPGTQPGKRSSRPQPGRNAILVGNVSQLQNTDAAWSELVERIAAGSVVVFLSPEAFRRDRDPGPSEIDVGWLPLDRKGRCRRIHDGLYHKENVARAHPVFAGLQGNGILDWYYYGGLIPGYVFQGQDEPEEVIAAAFAVGYCGGGSKGYESGILMSSYQLGSGHFIISTFPVVENLDANPAADRMMLNLVSHAARLCAGIPQDASGKETRR